MQRQEGMTPIAQAEIKLIAEMSAPSAPVCYCLNKRTAISISSTYSCPTSNVTDAHNKGLSINNISIEGGRGCQANTNFC